MIYIYCATRGKEKGKNSEKKAIYNCLITLVILE